MSPYLSNVISYAGQSGMLRGSTSDESDVSLVTLTEGKIWMFANQPFIQFASFYSGAERPHLRVPMPCDFFQEGSSKCLNDIPQPWNGGFRTLFKSNHVYWSSEQ